MYIICTGSVFLSQVLSIFCQFNILEAFLFMMNMNKIQLNLFMKQCHNWINAFKTAFMKTLSRKVLGEFTFCCTFCLPIKYLPDYNNWSRTWHLREMLASVLCFPSFLLHVSTHCSLSLTHSLTSHFFPLCGKTLVLTLKWWKTCCWCKKQKQIICGWWEQKRKVSSESSTELIKPTLTGRTFVCFLFFFLKAFQLLEMSNRKGKTCF